MPKTKEAGKKEILDAASLVQYKEESIVSKTILDKKCGTITVFAFGQGEGLSEHSAPYDAVVQVLDGEVEIRISGVPHILKRGQMIIMPANKPHALTASKKFKMILTMIKE